MGKITVKKGMKHVKEKRNEIIPIKHKRKEALFNIWISIEGTISPKKQQQISWGLCVLF